MDSRSPVLLVEGRPLNGRLDVVLYLCLAGHPAQSGRQRLLHMAAGAVIQVRSHGTEVREEGVVLDAIVVEWNLSFSAPAVFIMVEVLNTLNLNG